MSSHRTAATLGLLALSCVLAAQQPDSKPSESPSRTSDKPATLTMGTNLVNLPVVVRDRKGALIQTLTKDDFVLQVDGKPQPIRYFDHDADLPLTLGLLVDSSQSQLNALDEERSASTTFLDQMLKGKQDKAFIIQFAHETELLQDLTDSRPKLQAALKDLDSTPQRSSRSDDPDSRRDRGGTVLYDAFFLAADEILSKPRGRKAIILLTDGDDRGSKESLTKAIEAAQRADTTIYAIYFKGEEHHDSGDQHHGGRGGGFPGGGGMGWPGGGGGGRGGNNGGGQPGGGRGGEQRPDGKKILARMTAETGGRLFEVSRKDTVAQIYDQIGEELRAQYRLGYTPDADHTAEGYHQIDLTLKDQKAKLTVQTRDGYYTGK